MLCAGALLQQMTIPIGRSYDDRGMRPDSHDVVGAHLLVPLAGGAPQPARPAPSGAFQPAASTSGSSHDVAVRDAKLKRLDVQRGLLGTSHPASRPVSSILRSRSVDSEASSKRARSCRINSVDFGGDSEMEPHLLEATSLVSSIQHAVDAATENDDDQVHHELGRIIFMKRTVEQNGCKSTFVATVQDVICVVQALLHRRSRFLQQNSLPADHAMTPEQRAAIMRQWKDEYNKIPEQVELQLRDSWKDNGKGTNEKGHGKSSGVSQPAVGSGKSKGKGQRKGEVQGPAFGPNKLALKNGKHSRFSLHLQRIGGSKHVVEAIIFTGCVDPEELRNNLAKFAEERPVVNRGPDEKEALKLAAENAKHRYRSGRLFSERSSNDPKFYKTLSAADQQLVQDFRDDSLRVTANQAVIKWGHGTLIHGDGRRLAIGGSTGGLTRRIMDGFKAPRPDELQEYLRPATDTRC